MTVCSTRRCQTLVISNNRGQQTSQAYSNLSQFRTFYYHSLSSLSQKETLDELSAILGSQVTPVWLKNCWSHKKKPDTLMTLKPQPVVILWLDTLTTN